MSLELIQKQWGTRLRLYESPTLVVDKLEILPGKFCSRHYHNYKYNHFLVVEGDLKIIIDNTLMINNVPVLPGVIHYFKNYSLQKVICIETIWPIPDYLVDEEDIVRLT